MPNLKTFTDRALEEFDEKYGPIWHLWNQVVQVSAKLERTPNASPELAIKAFLTAKLQELAEEYDVVLDKIRDQLEPLNLDYNYGSGDHLFQDALTEIKIPRRIDRNKKAPNRREWGEYKGMNELLRQLEDGEFEQGVYMLRLRSGISIWTANGSFSLAFYPKSGYGFSFWEKRRLMKAIKKGRLKQALTLPQQKPLS